MIQSFQKMKLLTTLIIILITFYSWSQQIPDTSFDPDITHPLYTSGKGPLVLIDGAHHNFHQIDTRYLGFAKVLRKDGYKVEANKSVFTKSNLKNAKILVIANAVHESDTSEWILPNPSAFTPHEMEELVQWVRDGGSLFLIADHMPMPGAAEELAKKFGFTFYNGFATDTSQGLYPGSKKELDVFSKKNGTLGVHPITAQLSIVATFTGQAFKIPTNAVSLLTFDERYKILLPDTAWKFNERTKRISIKNFSQGAVLEFGQGRIAVFGEAAMFTAQRKGDNAIPFGLNSPDAPENLPFLLNIIHWLDRKI